MKAYLITTGAVFALLTLAHLLRVGELFSRFSSDPWYVLGVSAITVASAALSIWAWRLLRRLSPR